MFVRILLIASLCVVSCTSLAENLPQQTQSKLFLVGGAWKTCGSFGGSACSGKVKWSEEVKTENVYTVTPPQIQQIKDLKQWREEDKLHKAALLNVLQNFHHIHKGKTFGREDFRAKLKRVNVSFEGKSTSARTVVGDLPNDLYYPVYDILEAPNQTTSGEFIKEQASIEKTKYDSSKAIYQAFVQAAKDVTPEGQKPVILISSASGYDVFGAVDYYLSIFGQLGAQAEWLPVEATLGKMMDGNKLADKEACAGIHKEREAFVGVYNREKVYPYLASYQRRFCEDPQKLVELAQRANAIFFNGGDQSLTWLSFVEADNSDRPWLSALRSKFDAGKLAISGTSAGTAVQSGVAINAEGQDDNTTAQTAGMITGGTSDGAIIWGSENKYPWIERADPESNSRPVTYHGFGGLKFFPYGILDTHFSERGRQLRLAKLVLESEATFGFGVDETTALAATPINENNAEFEVIGQNGVYIVEQTISSVNQKDRIQFVSHYLVNGQRFSLNDGKLVFPESEFKSFTGTTNSIATDKDLTQKTEYRDLVESQINVGAKMATAVFENNDRRFSMAIQLNNKSGISTTASVDGLKGYTHSVVSVLLQ